MVISGSTFGEEPVNFSSAEDFVIISYAGVTNADPLNVYGNIALYHTPAIVDFINALPPSGVGYVYGTVFMMTLSHSHPGDRCLHCLHRAFQASTSVISGTGSMLITAPTLTILFGDNTFGGGVTIQTPREVLVENLTSKTSSPCGSGTFTLNEGTIDTVNGQLLQIKVGSYVQTGVEIAMHLEGTNSDDSTRFLVDGAADLSGGAVFVYDGTGHYVPYGGYQQNIIHTIDGLKGEFSNNFTESHFDNMVFDANFTIIRVMPYFIHRSHMIFSIRLLLGCRIRSGRFPA